MLSGHRRDQENAFAIAIHPMEDSVDLAALLCINSTQRFQFELSPIAFRGQSRSKPQKVVIPDSPIVLERCGCSSCPHSPVSFAEAFEEANVSAVARTAPVSPGNDT
jgi:hypothetical protein